MLLPRRRVNRERERGRVVVSGVRDVGRRNRFFFCGVDEESRIFGRWYALSPPSLLIHPGWPRASLSHPPLCGPGDADVEPQYIQPVVVTAERCGDHFSENLSLCHLSITRSIIEAPTDCRQWRWKSRSFVDETPGATCAKQKAVPRDGSAAAAAAAAAIAMALRGLA